jgi:RHH-type transcriptional regulator, rel operon repressor / antitoxin RelB
MTPEEIGMLSIRLDKNLEARLNNLVLKTGRSKSYYAKKALQEYIEDREDYNLAVAALENDDGQHITLKEAMKIFKVKSSKRPTQKKQSKTKKRK